MPSEPPRRREALAERIWYGADPAARAARALLTPAARVYAGVAGLRGILYDAGWLRTVAPTLPAISVGNLTVGGTGKTPLAAWLAAGLLARGARPAIVLRGYGGDEPLVHRVLNPSIPVVVAADRAAAIDRARAQGADLAILDDGFQHRHVRRVADVVLISADQWTGDVRLLPAGPWREPLDAVRRANVVIVVRKAAAEDRLSLVHEAVSRAAPMIPRVSVRLEPSELVRVGGDDPLERRPFETLRGHQVRALVAIGDPVAFVNQLEAVSAGVSADVYGDHHAFTDEEIAAFARSLTPGVIAVCTLKDAVKVGDRWPREAPPLWYVSQRVIVERGVGGIDRLLDDALRARHA